MVILIIGRGHDLDTACYTKKQAVSRFCQPSTVISDTLIKTDTVLIRTDHVIFDSVIIVPKSSLQVEINPRDSFQNINLVSGQGSLQVKNQNGKFLINCGCDSTVSRMRNEIKTLDSTVKSHNISKSEQKTTNKVEVEVLPWWVKPTLIALGILALPGIFMIIKFIVKRFI